MLQKNPIWCINSNCWQTIQLFAIKSNSRQNIPAWCRNFKVLTEQSNCLQKTSVLCSKIELFADRASCLQKMQLFHKNLNFCIYKKSYCLRKINCLQKFQFRADKSNFAAKHPAKFRTSICWQIPIVGRRFQLLAESSSCWMNIYILAERIQFCCEQIFLPTNQISVGKMILSKKKNLFFAEPKHFYEKSAFCQKDPILRKKSQICLRNIFGCLIKTSFLSGIQLLLGKSEFCQNS